jgi:CheY-like chemotaxis protein
MLRPMVPFDLRGVSILVVEDDPDALELMGMFLRPTGATVREARDGYEALMQALESPPDVVFCDLRMPRLDGHALIDQFKRHEDLCGIPFIATTGLGDDEDVLHTCLAGFAGHLVKPITPPMVDALLRQVLKQPAGPPATEAARGAEAASGLRRSR